MVVAERTATQPVEIVVRARPGPDSLEKAIHEQSAQGFICSLLWKEGATSMVVVMSRLPVDPTRRPEFVVDTIDPARLDGRSGVYIGDVPYLSDGQRVAVTINDRVYQGLDLPAALQEKLFVENARRWYPGL